MANLMNKRVAILAANGFEQSELAEPKKALDDAGAETFIVSPAESPIKGWQHGNWGDEFEVDVALDKANPHDYDMLVLPGGVMNPDTLRRDESVQNFVRDFFKHGKPVAAICHAPWTLIDADVVSDRKLTSYKTIQQDLKNAGAEWVDEPVVIDANLITSRNPHDLEHFNNAIIEMLRDYIPEQIDYREEELEASLLSDHPNPREQGRND